MKKAKLGKGCTVDLDRLIESRLLVQANSGGGKSHTVRKLLEETHGYCQQIVLDPEGEMHTLREKFDYVLAGKGGDCPADIKSAAMLARRLLELNVSAIIDIYELGAQRRLFVKRFLEALVNAPRDLWHRAIIVVEEAHMFCPEKDQAESAGAVVDLMTLGRKRGFCGVLATQRIAKLNKDAAAECNNKLIGRCALDVDMKRAGAELGFTAREDLASLRTLKPGEFFAFGPAIADEVKLIKIGDVQTTHLRAGQRTIAPSPPNTRIKKVLGQLADLPHEAEEEARTTAELKVKVRALEAELRKAKAAAPEAKVETKIVEKPVVKDAQLKQLDKVADKASRASEQALAGAKALNEAMSFLKNFKVPDLPRPAQRPASIRNIDQIVHTERPKAMTPRQIRAVAKAFDERSNGVNGTIAKGPAKILSALIQYPEGCTSSQIAQLTGYKATSRYEFIRLLKVNGYATEHGDLVVATNEGRAALPDVEPLPQGHELLEWWRTRLEKGERIILDQLVEVYPEGLSRADIEERTGYKATSIYEYSRKLTARKLVVDDGGLTKAAAILFD